MGHYNHSLSLDATWYQKTAQSLIDEHVDINSFAQQGHSNISTWQQHPITDLAAYNSKLVQWKFFYIYYQIVISMMHFFQSSKKIL